jgi:hypothetical protein
LLKTNGAAGWYYPSSLYIHLAEDRIEAGALIDPPSVLFHEYVHFLQDITTWCGCFNFTHFCNCLKLAQRHCIDSEVDPIELPVSLLSIAEAADRLGLKEVHQYYHDNNSYIRGDEEYPEGVLELQGVRRDVAEISTCHKAENVLLILHQKRSGESHEYRLGSIVLNESMAAACEAQFSHECNDWRTIFPYSAAYLISCHLGAEHLSACPALLSTACELALQTDRPAAAFLDIIELSKKVKPFSCRNLVEDCKNAKILDTATPGDSVIQDASESFGHVVQILPDLNKTKDWACGVFCRAAETSSRSSAYISTTIAQHGKEAWRVFRTDIGLPVVVDRRGAFFTDTDPDTNLFPIIGLEAFVQSLMPGGEYPRRCCLEEHCRHEPMSDMVAYNPATCREPWTRADDRQLCPMAVWYRLFGFSSNGLGRNG